MRQREPERADDGLFGGPDEAGGFDGLQAEYARIPYANVGLVKLPEDVSDDDAILISDIFPTGYMAADIAEIRDGDTVCVLGCGPVGQFAIWSAKHLGAGRVIAVDEVEDRLSIAREQGAETVDFSGEDPLELVSEMTRGIGPDRVIDCVGVEAEGEPEELDEELQQVAERSRGGNPAQALEWAVELVAKAGTIAIIGVYPPTVKRFPIGQAMMKNLSIQLGNCNHRKYIPRLVDLVRIGLAQPTTLVTQRPQLDSAIDAYEHFDRREAGWLKVALEVGARR